jgi:hypothetical protein
MSCRVPRDAQHRDAALWALKQGGLPSGSWPGSPNDAPLGSVDFGGGAHMSAGGNDGFIAHFAP